MSTQQPTVTVSHPFAPDETLSGERVGTARRRDSPHPWALVQVSTAGSEATIRVPSETLSD